MSADACRSLFPTGRYSVVLADPPWEYSRDGNMKAKPYPTMSVSELKALPVGSISERDCCLFLWATSPLLGDALAVMDAWGFRYVCVYKVWSKRTSTGKPAVTPGYWSLGSSEFLLLGTRGHMQRHKRLRDVKQELQWERGEHSEKPGCVRDEIRRLLGVESRVELFARQLSDGWDAWGLDVPGYFHSDLGRVSSSGVREKVRAVLLVDGGRVRLAYDVRTTRDAGTQTDGADRRAAREPGAAAVRATGETPQKRAAAAERVPVLRDGTPLKGGARPSRKRFAGWWNAACPDGRRRSEVYSVDPAYLESNPDVREIVGR